MYFLKYFLKDCVFTVMIFLKFYFSSLNSLISIFIQIIILVYKSICQAAPKGRDFVWSYHIRNLLPWGKEPKKCPFPCVYTTDPNNSKGDLRGDKESVFCCKSSLNTCLPNSGFEQHSAVCLWPALGLVCPQRVPALLMALMEAFPGVPGLVEGPPAHGSGVEMRWHLKSLGIQAILSFCDSNSLAVLELATAAPNPCSGWLHQSNRLGDFFPFAHLTH